MKRTLVFCLTVAALLIMAHHAPAPIVEESPKPAATAKPRPRPRPKVTPEAMPKPKPTPLSWAGTWQTKGLSMLSPDKVFGMQLSQTGDHVNGTYNFKGGVVDGTVRGNILSGTWTQTNSNGVFSFSWSSDGKSFSGTWTGTDGSTGPWTGQRQ